MQKSALEFSKILSPLENETLPTEPQFLNFSSLTLNNQFKDRFKETGQQQFYAQQG